MVLAGITEGTTTRQTLADVVSTGYFDALGVRPVVGRDFSLDEERPGSLRQWVIVSYRYWERLDFDRDVLERTMRINGQDYAIIGVAPGVSAARPRSSAPSSGCRSACTTKSKTNSTHARIARWRIAKPMRWWFAAQAGPHARTGRAQLKVIAAATSRPTRPRTAIAICWRGR